jgi:hypothetical protein
MDRRVAVELGGTALLCLVLVLMSRWLAGANPWAVRVFTGGSLALSYLLARRRGGAKG